VLDRPPAPLFAPAASAGAAATGSLPRTVDVDEHALAEMLIASGRLSEAEALCPELIERELSALIADFISRWRHDVTRP